MYDVGQVLYVVLNKKQKIIPVRICEQVIRKSLDGEDVQYLIAIPGRDKFVNLNSLNADVFTDILEVKDVMKDRVTSLIDGMADDAVTMAHEYFGLENPQDLSASQHNEALSSEGKVSVILDDGTVANIDMNSSMK